MCEQHLVKHSTRFLMSLLTKLISKEIADEAFETIVHNKKPKRVGSIRPESTSKLSKRLHLALNVHDVKERMPCWNLDFANVLRDSTDEKL